jgi:hypothetical protein
MFEPVTTYFSRTVGSSLAGVVAGAVTWAVVGVAVVVVVVAWAKDVVVKRPNAAKSDSVAINFRERRYFITCC